MAQFNRKSVRAIFENAGLEVPPKDVLTELCDLHQQNDQEKDERIKELEANLEAAEHERDGLKEDNGDGYKTKYENEKKAFEDYKKTVTEKEAKAAKEAAAKTYFESKNITGENLEIAMRAAAAEISAIELDGEKIKDTATLDALTSGTLAGLVKKTVAVGAQVAHPPANNTSGLLSMKEIYEKDERGRYKRSTEERQRAIAENLARKGK